MLYDQIQEAVQFIKSQTSFQAKYGLILGTGLSTLVDEMEVQAEISYRDIPHFPVSTVKSHKGKLVFGTLSNIPIVAMAGRFHYYEGYSMKQVTFPVRVLKLLNISHLFISNAAGSTNDNIEGGDIVFINDHINLQPENPLRGENDERLGPRFPDMLHTYDKALNAKGLEIARNNNIRAHEGVYVGLQGPNLETPAEYNYLNTIGGDVVGMSTIPEVLVAKHMGLSITVISVVSNKSYPVDIIQEVTLEEVIATVERAAPKMQLIVKELLKVLEG